MRSYKKIRKVLFPEYALEETLFFGLKMYSHVRGVFFKEDNVVVERESHHTFKFQYPRHSSDKKSFERIHVVQILYDNLLLVLTQLQIVEFGKQFKKVGNLKVLHFFRWLIVFLIYFVYYFLIDHRSDKA